MVDFDYKLRRNLGIIRKVVKDLRIMGMDFEIDKDVETMMGGVVDHVYIVDRMVGEIVLKKHILTIYQKDGKEDQ